MINKIFVINGSGGVGKDTFVSLFREVSKDFMRIINYSSVDRIKEIAREIGWSGEKDEKSRKFLSDLKVLCSEYNDLPFKCMNKVVEENKNKYDTVIFLHIREPQEIKRACKEFEAKSILIKRDSIKHIVSNEGDKNVFDYKYDIVINNDKDIGSLKRKANRLFVDVLLNSINREY